MRESLEKFLTGLVQQNKNLIGIDIGAREIKLAEVVHRRPGQIARLGRISTPSEAMEDGIILKKDLIAAALKKLANQSDTVTRQAATIVAGKNVVTRYVKLPKMAPKEVASTLKWEADKFIPVSNEKDLVIEHIILGDADDELTPQINVLLVAVPRRIVYQLHDTFNQAGLELIAVEIEPLSLWRSLIVNSKSKFNTQNPNEVVISLDIGAKAANFSVFSPKGLKFSRYIPSGGEAITNYLAHRIGLDPEATAVIKEKDAEILVGGKKESADSDQLTLSDALEESLGALLHEITRSIDFYRIQHKRDEFKSLIVTGGTAKLKGIDTYLEQKLGINVTLGLQNMPGVEKSVSFQFGGPQHVDPAFAVAVGLAQRGVMD